MKVTYYPNRGDIVMLDFDPQSGHEQAGRRPALVLSPRDYNRKIGLMLCCPITNQRKGYPFEVPLSGGQTTGVVLADHLKSVDYHARGAKYKERASPEALADVIAKFLPLIAD